MRDLRNVLMAVQASVRANPRILKCEMGGGKLGGTTTIVFSHARGLLTFEFVRILATVKAALLDAASSAEEAYVMGYESKPFKALGMGKNTTWGFTASLGVVPATHQGRTCWDTYRKGSCPRRSTCRWCHPVESDLLNLVVMLKEHDQGQRMHLR